MGHVMISVVIAPLVVGVLWLLGLIMQLGTDLGTIVVLGLVATVTSEILMALGERPAVVRARHSTPGGWAYAMWIFVVPPLVGFVVGVVGIAPGRVADGPRRSHRVLGRWPVVAAVETGRQPGRGACQVGGHEKDDRGNVRRGQTQ